MDGSSGVGKSPNTSLSFRYNATNDELEELCDACDDDPPTPQFDAPSSSKSDNSSPKRTEKTTSILDKYFKSLKTEKIDDLKSVDIKPTGGNQSPPKDVTSSPMKEYLKNLGKRNTSEVPTDSKEAHTETWKLFHDFKFKITQAVEDMKTRSVEENKEKSVPRENSVSDSEENSAVKDSDQSVGDTDNQVSSLNSSLQNLSELTQPATTKPQDSSLPVDVKQNSESSDETHKNLDVSKYNDSSIEVESGVEALEDAFDTFEETDGPVNKNSEIKVSSQTTLSNVSVQPNESNSEEKVNVIYFNAVFYIFTSLVVLSFAIVPYANLWNGFLLGLWTFCFASNIKKWVLQNYFSDEELSSRNFSQMKHANIPTYTVPSIKEHRPLKKYEGWINHYRSPDYDPSTYHINKTTTAFMKLEGTTLRISYTMTKIGKRALWDEKIDKVTFYQHRIYNLNGARVILLPKGLVRRRQWSKKYPICIILSEDEKIQVLEKETTSQSEKRADSTPDKKKETPETENAETNTSPEKKKKFVWRKREKSATHSDVEGGKEGLRHRIARKMHKDKKHDVLTTSAYTPELPDNVTIADRLENTILGTDHDSIDVTYTARPHLTSVNNEEFDLDETDLNKIKEFLEEAEVDCTEGAVDTEWSLHVKHSKDNHSHIYLFGRTGREKQEWFRRLSVAISEANVSLAGCAEQSSNEEKSVSESVPNTEKEGIELAVYHHHATEKECVSFGNKGQMKIPSETVTEPVPPSVTQTTPQYTMFDYLNKEETFWAYFLKIVQSHDVHIKQNNDIAIMCDLPNSSTSKKKKCKKKFTKNTSASPTCDCRILPADVQWLNMMLARVMFDVMRDPLMKTRLQTKIQNKLQTLKLPSFMSPIVVTDLSLSGACPLLERVSPPTWDERGLWLDVDMAYAGGLYITILTQINLMKLKQKNIDEQSVMTECSETDASTGFNVSQRLKAAIYDSDLEDSAESSSDDETPPLQPVDSNESVTVTDQGIEPSSSSKKKFLRIVDRIATNKYFQTVTDYKYVKRAMEGLSNTDIKLQVEVQGLEGRLAVNLPTPPHDRIWLGFRTNPQLVLKARPTVGARTLRFAHISNWIEEKLTKEFEKILVIPNMEDFIVDIMTPPPIDFE